MVKITRSKPKAFAKLVVMTGATGTIVFSQTISSMAAEVPPLIFEHMSSEAQGTPESNETFPYLPTTAHQEIMQDIALRLTETMKKRINTLEDAVIEMEASRKGKEENLTINVEFEEVRKDNLYLTFAVEAGDQLGWDPLLIYSQWRHETGNFTSDVFVQNNNLAGLTWYPDSGYEKGTPRPEGGHYINYPTPVEGYIDFIERSPRYGQVKTFATAEEQAEEIARAGWAADPHYAEKLKRLIRENRIKFGHVLAVKENVY